MTLTHPRAKTSCLMAALRSRRLQEELEGQEGVTADACHVQVLLLPLLVLMLLLIA